MGSKKQRGITFLEYTRRVLNSVGLDGDFFANHVNLLNRQKLMEWKNSGRLETMLNKGQITNDKELDEALELDRNLRLVIKTKSEHIDSRKQLRSMIKTYEKLKWS